MPKVKHSKKQVDNFITLAHEEIEKKRREIKRLESYIEKVRKEG